MATIPGAGKLFAGFRGGFWRALAKDVAHSGPWRSAFKHPLPQTPKEQSEIAITSFWMHLHPATVSRKSLKFSVTYGLGGLSAGLFAMLLITGIMLMFYYVPATDHAYKDMVDLQSAVSLGKILRNMHRWAAHLMVIVVCLHMLRVFIQKGYKPPRQFNWVIGVVLLVLTMMLSFTGYLLPWDQLALWAVTVGTNMAGAIPLIGEKFRYVLLGGPAVDQATLIRFYVLHVIVLPVAIMLVMVFHFWRVRKDGFSGGLEHDA
ncbi:MAG TPA: cytochrome b N-terminal domain-containing protein [Fimbriimonadaceae bacterium]|nr:cytochrome b N-terminal domain-containing protein [Fimbriimonadaceae bacterium]